MKIQVSREKERERARQSRDLPQREEIKHLRKLNLYILSTHTNNCAHIHIGRLSISN